MYKLLSNLMPHFDHLAVAADGVTPLCSDDIDNISISSLVFDSRAVSDGSMYFALPGTHVDGKNFIAQAVENGAAAIVFEGELSKDVQIAAAKAVTKRSIEDVLKEDVLKNSTDECCKVAFLKVENARFAMGPISAAFYDNPSKKLAVIGVTGTEGKSSTVSFIWQLLRICGKKAGFISTVEYSFGNEAVKNPEHQTTPEAPIIQHHLNEMVLNGCEYAVIEASSHGLSEKTNRLGDVLFDCAVFMNVTLEHLEFHGTFENYRDDKARLFKALDLHDHKKIICGKEREIVSIGVANLEDVSADFFIKSVRKPVYGFTTEGKAGKAASETGENAHPLPRIPVGIKYMTALNIAFARLGIDFTIETTGEDSVLHTNDDSALPSVHKHIKIRCPLQGAFNAYNIMASIIAVSSVTGVKFEELAGYVKELVPVKGRMTAVNKGQPFEVIIDYAHTPSSFETIFPPLKKRCSGRMLALFGSGGERDVVKRPLQGEIAARFCDVVVLADEDPRKEDPVALLEDISVGAVKGGLVKDKNLFIIPDRKKAIIEIFKMAEKDDIVLLLGKGHENSIIYKDYVMPYDELAQVELVLSEMGYTG